MALPIKEVDTSSAEYKRGVIKVVTLVIVLGLIGGGLLAYKISAAEKAHSTVTTQSDADESGEQTSSGSSTRP